MLATTKTELSDECPVTDHYSEFDRKPNDRESWLHANKDSKQQDVDSLELRQTGSKAGTREEKKRQGDGYVAAEKERDIPVPNHTPDPEDISKVEGSITDDVPSALNQQEGPKVPEEAEQGSSAPPNVPKSNATVSFVENFNPNVCPTGEVERNINVLAEINSQSLQGEGHLPNSKGTEEVIPELPKSGIISEEGIERDVPDNHIGTVTYRIPLHPSPDTLTDVTTKFVDHEQRERKSQQTVKHGDKDESCVQQSTAVSQSGFEDSDLPHCQPEQHSQQHLPGRVAKQQQQHTTLCPLEGENAIHSKKTTDNRESKKVCSKYSAVLTSQLLGVHHNRPDLTELSDEWMEVTPPPSPLFSFLEYQLGQPSSYEATPSPNPCLFVSSYMISSLEGEIRAQNPGMPMNERAALVPGMVCNNKKD